MSSAYNAPWPAEHIQALRDFYPTGGWHAVHVATGRTQHGICSMAKKLGVKCDPAAVQRLADEGLARAGKTRGRPRITEEEKARRNAAKARAVLVRKPKQHGVDESGEVIDENDYPRRVVIQAADAPRIKGRVISSVFDLAEV